ncbi:MULTISPECIES: putative quinol monooxygenase [Myxococcus]|uniref:putative quinol monooxygenase n=1 Tax=Myxococcus TaxID=32 RepID=UPI00114254CD|nr:MULTISPECIES: antibiotic biosynthesis monooxygenase [Myxococcus]MCK8504216.1 antibiotic biosynthesis monooxygenase [Myxococcus fulvus]
MSLLVICEFKTRAGGETEFLRAARALATVAATEPGTLRYQWFTTQKPGHYSIIEEYVDADAAETHNNHVGALLRELFAVSDLVSISFFGELNAYLREWATGREGVAVNVAL